MKKRSQYRFLSVVLLFSMFNINLVLGGIYFSDFENRFNLGDMINLNVMVDPIKEGHLLKVLLFCQDSETLQFNNLPNDDGSVNIKLPLNHYTLNTVNGRCYFSGEYDGETRKSKEFEISNKLNVYLSGDSFFAYPGEDITVSGNAERLNGQPVDGEVEISIPLLQSYVQTDDSNSDNEEIIEDSDNSSEEVITETVGGVSNFNGKVKQGSFSVNFVLDDNTPAGEYRIDTLVYESISGVKSSEGMAIANLKVFQILKNVEIALNNQNFDPGNNIEFVVNLLDQTGQRMIDDVSITVKNDKGERIFEKIIKSQENVGYDLPTNVSSGYYEIAANSGGISGRQTFFVNEKAIVFFELENTTLVITNIGNIPYKKSIEIELNGKPFVKDLELGLGESKEFELSGNNEEYNIKISDGESELIKGGIVLTGHSVGVNEGGEENVFDYFSLTYVWIFIIIILLIVAIIFIRKVLKKKSYAYPNKDSLKNAPEKKELPKKAPGALIPPSEAEQVLVMKGHRNRASVIVLKIKNKISQNSKNSLEKAIEHVYQKRGAVYEQGDFIYIIFSPLMTRLNKNEAEAARAANKILLLLNEHNKKFLDKIDFGIGINSGDIINKIENKKLKFTALGNFILGGKRLAEVSDKQVLVTKEAYERGISDIKADKKSIGNGEVYEVKNVLDNEGNQKFINGFLKRMEKDNRGNANQ